ncbi:hypothetical protein CK489_12725 [Bradyrhizobium sp. UFLA03-84]|nr:hypothetical protein CK489_12725 [Bradyrhizobium sp. UFLA03-84]
MVADCVSDAVEGRRIREESATEIRRMGKKYDLSVGRKQKADVGTAKVDPGAVKLANVLHFAQIAKLNVQDIIVLDLEAKPRVFRAAQSLLGQRQSCHS